MPTDRPTDRLLSTASCSYSCLHASIASLLPRSEWPILIWSIDTVPSSSLCLLITGLALDWAHNNRKGSRRIFESRVEDEAPSSSFSFSSSSSFQWDRPLPLIRKDQALPCLCMGSSSLYFQMIKKRRRRRRCRRR